MGSSEEHCVLVSVIAIDTQEIRQISEFIELGILLKLEKVPGTFQHAVLMCRRFLLVIQRARTDSQGNG